MTASRRGHPNKPGCLQRLGRSRPRRGREGTPPTTGKALPRLNPFFVTSTAQCRFPSSDAMFRAIMSAFWPLIRQLAIVAPHEALADLLIATLSHPADAGT